MAKRDFSLYYMKIKLRLFLCLLHIGCIFVQFNMEVLSELKTMGESLGYDGPCLQEFIREQQALLREERAAARQKEKEDREYNLKLQSFQLEKEKAEALLVIEKQKSEREVRLKKEEIENEIKLKQVEHTHEMEV